MLTTDVQEAARILRGGGVVAYPTEAVYGLGCDPRDEAALARLLAIKAREADKGLILLAANRDQLAPFLADHDKATEMRLDATWPGPMTWILPARPTVSSLVTGGRSTVAARVTAHATAAELCRTAGMAIVSTSANTSGGEPCREADAVRDCFGDAVDCILIGECGDLPGPTEIRDGISGEVLRPDPRKRAGS